MPREFEPNDFDEYAEFKRRYPQDIRFLDKLLVLAVNDQMPWRLVNTLLIGTLSLDHLTPDASIAETLDIPAEEVQRHVEELFENRRLYEAWEKIKDTEEESKPKRIRHNQSPKSSRPSGVVPSDPRIVPLRNVEKYTGPVIKRKKQPQRFDPNKSFFEQTGNGEPTNKD